MDRILTRVLFGIAVACLAATAPIKTTRSGTLTLNQACAQTHTPDQGGGTCCPEQDSICIVDAQPFQHYYFKESGSCKGS
ncbi:MAG TPA: hypothetical protein VF092_05890 [Longimicrobium sp.]